jgi:ABC-type phosphate transport system permease subunit
LEEKAMNNKKIYQSILNNLARFALTVVLGLFVSAFSYSAITAQAADTEEVVTIDDEAGALADSTADAENGGGAMILLLGGMLLIIIAVVISVVATFVVTAPIADEI